ncbi:agglutinin biogenesis protein MshI [Noviherbaspirillum cavernae]|nr:agglutinin biogenesis protein MshI [Noviherbaspirillum cavernae]
MAISLQADGVCVAHVERSSQAKYAVAHAGFYSGGAGADAEALGRIAKDLRADRYRWTNLLSLGEYQMLSVDAPNVPPDELKTAIRWRLKDMLDYHIDDATIDVLDVPAEKNSRGRAHAMYAVAARNQLIERRQALFDDARLPIRVIDIPEMAQRNVSALLEPEGRGLAMLSLHEDSGLLTITFDGELYLSRRIDVALSQLTAPDENEKAAAYERMVQELQRSLDHFDRQYHFVTVARLVLAPSGSMTADVQAHLAASLYIPIETLNLESVVDISRVPELKSPQSQQRYFMTIGAAMRHEVKAL